jgi:hypothetical protein
MMGAVGMLASEAFTGQTVGVQLASGHTNFFN